MFVVFTISFFVSFSRQPGGSVVLGLPTDAGRVWPGVSAAYIRPSSGGLSDYDVVAPPSSAKTHLRRVPGRGTALAGVVVHDLLHDGPQVTLKDLGMASCRHRSPIVNANLCHLWSPFSAYRSGGSALFL